MVMIRSDISWFSSKPPFCQSINGGLHSFVEVIRRYRLGCRVVVMSRPVSIAPSTINQKPMFIFEPLRKR